jgi:hypothetical protein
VDLNNPTTPTLVVTGGAQHGAFHTIQSMPAHVIVGAGESATFRLKGDQIAEHHAEVAWDVRGLILRDLGSAAGTFVNGQPVRDELPLRDGDRVSLGAPGGRGAVKLHVRVPAYVGTLQGMPGLLPGQQPMPFVRPPADYDPSAETHPGRSISSLNEHDALFPRDIDLDAPTGAFQDSPATVTGMTPPPLHPLADEEAAAPVGLKERFPVRTLVIAAVGLAAIAVVYYAASWWLRPVPAIKAIAPTVVQPGQTFTIAAENLVADAKAVIVTMNGAPLEVTAASPTSVTTTALASIEPGPATIAVISGGTPAGSLTLTVVGKASFAGLEPDVAMPGETVGIAGQNLDPARLSVTIDNKPAEVMQADNQLRVTVPAAIVPTPGKGVNVVVKANGVMLPPRKLFLGKLPFVREIAPANGQPGTRVTIKGAGFDETLAGNDVRFGGQQALVLSASAKELVVSAPDAQALAGGETGVVVAAHGGTTSAVPFDLRPVSISMFEPFFYPLPAPAEAGEGKVLVATAIGPFALLTSASESHPVAERAARLCQFLNELVAAAKTGSVAVEARDGNPPGVGIVGRGIFVVATAEDAAGYASAYTGLRTAPSQAALARHWAALLDDYLTLFVRNERPLRAIGVTPKAKVLLDLYADPARGANARGVPMALLRPAAPDMTMARSLRELSLQVSGSGAAATALAGDWLGQMQDNAGPRRIRVEFSGRGGTFTTFIGSASVDSKVASVSAGGDGTVTFTVQIRGTLKRFTGKLAGESLRGSVQSQDGTGSFSLDLDK